MSDVTRTHASEHGEPSSVRAAVLKEHADIRSLLGRVEETARRLALSAAPDEAGRASTYEAAHLLCRVMVAHIELEDRVLAPALERIDAWGAARAERLRAEHADQLRVVRSYLAALDHLAASAPSGPVLAEVARQLVETIRKDMEVEEQTVLSPELWRDAPACGDGESG